MYGRITAIDTDLMQIRLGLTDQEQVDIIDDETDHPVLNLIRTLVLAEHRKRLDS